MPRDGADMKYRAQEKMVQTLVQYFIRNKSRPEQTCDRHVIRQVIRHVKAGYRVRERGLESRRKGE